MMESLLSRENLLSALERVETNKGSHGVDGMSVKDLRDHIKQNWQPIRESILNGSYEPSPVRRVEIPKPNGGTRLLGIPTVMDRFIQQAITQVLTPVFDPEFSEHSYGFRPKRRGHDAVRKAKIKELTSRKNPISMEKRIKELNQYLIGWCGYYALADTPRAFQELDEWTRRRLRMCQWKEWKLPRTKVRKLISLGVPKHRAYEWGNTRKKYWRIACSPILHRTMDNQYWITNGLKSLSDRYKLLRNMP